MQLSKRELQNLNGFLGGEANWDSDTRSALLLSDGGPRKSTRSKPTIIETPEPDLIARDTSLRKGNTPAGPRRKPKATTSESQLSVEKAGLALDQNVISSISTLSEPPSDLHLDDEEVPVPPAKRQKRNLPVVGRPGGSQRSGVILRLPFNDAENQRKFNDLDNAREAHLNDTDHATSDVHDGTEFRTDTETDDIDDESDYAPTPARRSTKRVQRIPSGSTTAVMRPQALKATLLRSPRVQKGPTPRTPFLNRSRKLGLVTPPATPNGIFSIEPLPFYEDRRESNAIDTSVPKKIRTTGHKLPSLPGLRQIHKASRGKSALPSPSQLFEDVRRLEIDSHREPASASQQHSVVLQQPISLQQLQVRAGLDPVIGRDYESKSKALMQMTKSKPKPQGKPPVWADSRQVLCETVPYYRSHHGAGYANRGVAYSFMFDAQASDRDYMDSTVIVSRAGGGMGKDEETGKMIQTQDTKETHIVRAFKNGVKFQQPVCIITGGKNPTAQFEIPHQYCVLDWFKPTHVWAEKLGDRRVIRYRFEVLDSSKTAWWKGEGVVEPVQLGELPPPFSHECPSCQRESQQIYLNGWICTNYDCPSLWRFVDGTDPDNSTLVYDPRWLKQKTPWSHTSPPQATKPDPWILANGSKQFDHGMVWQATKGIACPNCDRCGAREHWTYWKCRNCHTRYEAPRSIVTPDLLHDWLNPVDTGYAHTKDDFHESVKLSLLFMGNYRVHIYTIPGIDGFVAHMLANKTVNEERDGPDAMFLQLQKEDIGLKRVSMKPVLGSESVEDGLTNQFTKNFGMPYKFVASPESSSMEDAPKAIQDCRSRLNWACRTILAKQGQTLENEFNEVLALAYMQGNKINYHDDGEFGLGPTIATLSLGNPATMTLRMKQKHYRGCTDKRFVDRPPLPGSLKYEERLAAHNALKTFDKKSPAYRKRLSDLPSQLGLMNKTSVDPTTGKTIRIKGEQDPVVSLKLCHGGIVIMHGAAIQECFEHAVVPEGKMRLALTCRYIDADSLEEHEKPTWAVEKEKEPYDGFKLPAPKQ